MDRSEIIGTGWSFPIDVNSRGGISLSRNELDIEHAIKIIILTPTGRRIMRPNFGCRIHELVFAPMNASTYSLARRYVTEALEQWEPRIRVLSVKAHADTENEGRMLINLEYEVKNTYDRRALVVPFYRIPEEH